MTVVIVTVVIVTVVTVTVVTVTVVKFVSVVIVTIATVALVRFFSSQFEFWSFVTPQHLDNRPLSGQLFAILAMFSSKFLILSNTTVSMFFPPITDIATCRLNQPRGQFICNA